MRTGVLSLVEPTKLTRCASICPDHQRPPPQRFFTSTEPVNELYHTVPMETDMKELYEAVWGQESRFIREFTVLVPRAEYGIRPGYRVTMRPSKMGAFAPSEFTMKRQMKSFKVMEVGAVLPCGTKRILIRPEYETIRRRLIRAEKERRLGASRSSTKLDYQISGQPGIGMQSSALQFLNSGGSLEIGKHNPCLYRDLHGISRNNFWGFFY